jgi:hypothetical protein
MRTISTVRVDTVMIWPGETVRIAVDFRKAFGGAQLFLFHCHNLEHEDGNIIKAVPVQYRQRTKHPGATRLTKERLSVVANVEGGATLRIISQD